MNKMWTLVKRAGRIPGTVDGVGTGECIQAQYEQEKQADHEPHQLTIAALLQPDACEISLHV